jgi:hypothetical protein
MSQTGAGGECIEEPALDDDARPRRTHKGKGKGKSKMKHIEDTDEETIAFDRHLRIHALPSALPPIGKVLPVPLDLLKTIPHYEDDDDDDLPIPASKFFLGIFFILFFYEVT